MTTYKCRECGKSFEGNEFNQLFEYDNCPECEQKNEIKKENERKERRAKYSEEYKVLDIVKTVKPYNVITTESDDFDSLAKKQGIAVDRKLSLQDLSLDLGVAYWFISKDGNVMAYEEGKQYAIDGFVTVIKFYKV